MTNSLFLILFLLPLVPIVLLYRATNNVMRRSWLLALALCLFIIALLYSLVLWTVRTEPYPNFAEEALGAGVVMRALLNTIWAPALYGLLIVIAGYLANRAALRRIERQRKLN